MSRNVASLAVSLHVNSATFKSGLAEAYQTGARESRRFAAEVQRESGKAGEALLSAGRSARGLSTDIKTLSGHAGTGSASMMRLHSVLNSLSVSGHTSAASFTGALIPALERTLHGMGLLSTASREQQTEQSRLVQVAYATAKAQLGVARADRESAQAAILSAEKDLAEAKAQGEKATALARYYDQQKKVNAEYGLAVNYREEYAQIQQQLREADIAAEVAVKRHAAAVKALTAAEKQEAAGQLSLRESIRQLTTGTQAYTVSARAAGAASRFMSAGLALLGGPAGLAITALVAGAGALWSAYDRAEAKVKALNAAMLDSGAGAGLTLSRLKRLNNKLGDTEGSLKAVTAAAKAGFTGDMLDQVATLASQMEEMGGNADELVRQLSAISGDPVKAMQEATQQGYEFNAAQIEQIATLARQGREAEAIALVQKIVLGDVAQKMADLQRQAKENATWWDRLKESVSGAMGAYAEAQIATTRAQAAAMGVDIDAPARKIEQQNKERKKAENARAEAERKRQDEQTAQIRKESELGAAIKAGTDKTRLAANATAFATERYKAGKITLDEYNAALRGIDKLYGDHKKTAEYHDSEGVRRLAQLQQQSVVLKAQGQETEKMTESQKKLLAFDQEIASYSGKKLTADQQSVLSMQDQIRAQLELNASIEQQNQQNKLSVTLSRQLQDVRDETANRAREQANALAQMTMSDAAYSQMVAEQQVRESFASRQKELDREVTDHASLLYQMQTQNLQDEMEKQIAIVRKGAEDKKRAEEDYTAGFKKGAEEWVAENSNAYNQMRQFTTRSLDSMADSLANFALTGKMNFKGLVVSILSDLAKMEMRIAASKALGMLLNWGASAIGGGAGAAVGSSGTAIQNYGANFQFNAKGGVYSSPDLSAYSNSVVRNPTPFMFAKGAGLMGEAGPEAILPLTRNSRGQLSVHASGQNSGGVVINQNFNFSVKGDQETGMPDRGAMAEMADTFRQIVRDVISEERRDGGMLSGGAY
ncbi:phage tail tape measure protein [Salmonella enterica]|nr:phage tail tape measure protein [Salmonella enterica]